MPKNRSRRSLASRVGKRRERHISIRSELRKEPDLQKIARSVVAMALAQAEKEVQAEAARREHEGSDNDQ